MHLALKWNKDFVRAIDSRKRRSAQPQNLSAQSSSIWTLKPNKKEINSVNRNTLNTWEH